jgi:hypothetical protein
MTKLHITFVQNVFTIFCLFHNLLLGRKEMDVEHFMKVMQAKAKEDLEA